MSGCLKILRNIEPEDTECFTCHPDSIYRPPIWVFLRSTSEDFREEINYLKSDVFPLLSEFCDSRRSSFKVLDMQWASHEGSHHQSTDSHHLKVSLDFIAKYSPFFICLLGQKYGEYCPPDASGTDVEALSKVEKNIQIAARNGYSWILHEDYKNYSLMELEITEAALLKNSGFSFFYFRDSQYVDDILQQVPQEKREMIESKYKSRDHYEERKVWELKEKIVNKGLPVEIFRTVEELGEAVLINCRDAIDKLYPMDLVPLQTGMFSLSDHESYLELCYHEAFSQRYSQTFVQTTETKKVFRILDTFAGSSRSGIYMEANNGLTENKRTGAFCAVKPRCRQSMSVILLCGEKGCGKSTVICNWLKHFTLRNPSILVITHFVGSSSASHDIMSFMRHCILKLRHEYFGTQHHPDAFSANPADIWTFQMIREAFIAAIGLKPCVLVLDGADQLTGTHGMSMIQVKEFSWLPWPLPRHCRLIVTSATSNLAYKSLSMYEKVKLVHLSNRTEDTFRIRIFQNHLAMPHKELHESHIQNIMDRKLSTIPLVLVILANELRVCGAFRNETDCLDEYLHCHSIQELWAAVLRRWIEDYSWVNENMTDGRVKDITPSSSGMKGWIVDVLCLLSISRFGLNEEDIHQLLKHLGYVGTNEVSSFDWAVFRTASMEWIQERPDGLLNFTHKSIRDAVEHYLLGVISPVTESTFKSFQNHFNCEKTHIHQLLAEYFSQQDYTLKLYQELPWHLTMSGNLSHLCTVLSDPLIMNIIYQNSKHSYHSKLDLVYYWDWLLESGFDPAVAYHNMVNELLVTSKVPENGDREMLSNDRCSQATLIWFTAEFLKELDKTLAAEELLLIAQALLPESCPLSLKETEIYFKVQYSIGQLCVSVGKLEDAEMHFRKALHSIDYAPKNIRKNLETLKYTAQLLFKLANLIMRGGSTEIGDILQKSRKATKKTRDPRAKANLKILEGFRKIHVGKLSEAEHHFQQALDIRQKWYGKLHPIVAEVMEPLADLLCYPEYTKSLDWSKTEDFYRKMTKIQEDSMKRTRSSQIRDQINLSRALTIYKLGKLLQNNGNYQAKKEARECLRHSFDLLTELLGPTHHLTMEVRRLLKHSEIQICKDQMFFKRLAADGLRKSLNSPARSYSQVKPGVHFTHERPKVNTKSSSQVGSRQMAANFKSAKATHPVDYSVEKIQADDGSNVSSDMPVVLEQNVPEDYAILEEEGLGNLGFGSKLYISKHALLPWLTLSMDHQESPVNGRNLSTPTTNRSLSTSSCRPLTTCKPSTFGPSINTSVPPVRTIYQSAWHHQLSLPKPSPPKRHLIRKDTGIARNLQHITTLLNNGI
ncbi:tetratricopeptide repeat protein 41-like [Mustelus asterias]